MRYVAAYLLAVLGGNKAPSDKDLSKILGSVGIEVNAEQAKKVIGELKGKDLAQVIAAGSTKLASVPSGGGGAPAAAAGAPAAAESKKEDKKEDKKKKEESEEEDDDMGFGLFD